MDRKKLSLHLGSEWQSWGENVLPVRNFILISAFTFDVVVFAVVTFPTEWNG